MSFRYQINRRVPIACCIGLYHIFREVSSTSFAKTQELSNLQVISQTRKTPSSGNLEGGGKLKLLPHTSAVVSFDVYEYAVSPMFQGRKSHSATTGKGVEDPITLLTT